MKKFIIFSALFFSVFFSFLFPIYVNTNWFWFTSLGINAFLITFVFVLLLRIVQYFMGKSYNKVAMILLLPIFSLAGGISLYSYNYFSLIAVPVLLVLIFMYSFWSIYPGTIKELINRILSWDLLSYIFSFFGKVFDFLEKLFVFKHLKNNDQVSQTGFWSGKKTKIILGLLIAIPLTIIFVNLFASADLIFRDSLQTVGDFFEDLINGLFDFFAIDNLSVSFAWLVRLLILFVGFYVFFQVHIKDRKIADVSTSEQSSLPGAKSDEQNYLIGVTVLSVLNLFFVIFVGFQVSFLLGHQIVFDSGITYSNYAREGFMQLALSGILVAIVSLFVQLTDRLKKSKALRFLNVMLLAQTIIIALSALKRVFLYVDSYGLTRLRFTVEHFVLFTMGILILMIVLSLRKKPLLVFFNYGFLLFLVYLSGLSLFNTDLYIAKNNFNRYLKGAELDVRYLASLSIDAKDEIQILEKMYNDSVFAGECSDQKLINREELQEKIDKLQEDKLNKQKMRTADQNENEIVSAWSEKSGILNSLEEELGNWTSLTFSNKESMILELQKTNPVHAAKMDKALKEFIVARDIYYAWINQINQEIKVIDSELNVLSGYMESGIEPVSGIDKPEYCFWGGKTDGWWESNFEYLKSKLDLTSPISKDSFFTNKKYWGNLTVTEFQFLSDYWSRDNQ